MDRNEAIKALNDIMGWLIASTPPNGPGAGLLSSVIGSGVGLVGAAPSNITGTGAGLLSATTALGSGTVDLPAGSNPWDPPTADVTNTLSSFTRTNMVTAIADGNTYLAANPGKVYRINAPGGSGSATLSADIDMTPVGKLIIDQKLWTWNQSGGVGLRATGDYVAGSQKEVKVAVSGGKTTVEPLSGTFISSSPGDIWLVYSNHKFYGDISNSRRHGELMEVESATSSLITFTTDLRYRTAAADRGGPAFTSADRPFIAKMNINRRLWLINCLMVGDPTQVVKLIDIRSMYKPAIIKPDLNTNGNIPGGTINCYNDYLIDPHIGNAPNAAWSPEHNKKTYIRGKDILANNFYSTETGPDSNMFNPGVLSQNATLTQLQAWGPTIDMTIESINTQEATVGAGPGSLGAHPGAHGTIWKNCLATNIPGSTTSIFPSMRGKAPMVDGGTFTRRAGFQPYAYPSKETQWAGPDYLPYRDGSDAVIKNATVTINGSGGSGCIWIGPNPPFANTFIDNLTTQDMTWIVSNTSGKFNFSNCGTVFVTRDIFKPSVNVSTVYNLTRPSIVTGTTAPTDVTFTDVIINLVNHPNSGTLTIVSCPSNCVARGNITVTNKPSGLTVVGKTGSGNHSGLTVTVS